MLFTYTVDLNKSSVTSVTSQGIFSLNSSLVDFVLRANILHSTSKKMLHFTSDSMKKSLMKTKQKTKEHLLNVPKGLLTLTPHYNNNLFSHPEKCNVGHVFWST